MNPEERAEADRIAAENAKREERGDAHIPTPDEEKSPELSTDDLAAVANEGHVPYARLKESERAAREEREARIALETENRMLRERAAPAKPAEPEVDLKALRKQRNDALLEGDTDRASDLDEQIDAVKERQLTERIGAAAEVRAEARVTARELRSTAAAIVKEYPFLDSQSEDKNPEAIAETLEWRDFYINKGYAAAEALQRAVDRVVPGYVDANGKGTDDLARKREALALSRGAATARNQPTAPFGGKGARAQHEGPITDVGKLSDKEFNAIPESEKRKLRGD